MMAVIEEAGRVLAEARRERRPIEGLPGGLPVDEATAYGIQATAVRALGQKRIGYKIGATSPEIQAFLGTDHPCSGPLFEPDYYPSGATIAKPSHGLLGLEPEFALRLGADLPPRDRAYGVDDVRGAIASVHPSFEIVGLRLPNELSRNILASIADFAANIGLVAGDGVHAWEGHDLSAIRVSTAVDGKEVASGYGTAAMGHPVNVLVWLLNRLSAEGEGLKADDWICTGTCGGIVPIEPGQEVSADFGPIGKVSVKLTGS